MTVETKYVIAPEDILAIRFECAKCHASTSIPASPSASVYASELAGAACQSCHTPWNITPNSAEHKALTQFVSALDAITKGLQGRSLMLRLEVKGIQP
jgi:hypothetical protein